MTNDQHHLSGAYALDALTPEERRAYEAHYPTCELCLAEVNDYRETAAELAGAAAATPPPQLKTNVMAEIATTRQLLPTLAEPEVANLAKRRSRIRPALVMAVAAAVVAVLGTVAGLRLGQNQPSVDTLLAAPDAVVTNLEGDAGAVTIVWSPSSQQVAVVANNLPDPGPNQTYELWFVVGDGVVPAGLFIPESGTIAQVLEVTDVDAVGWGITIEPAEGSDQPTGDILYRGSI